MRFDFRKHLIFTLFLCIVSMYKEAAGVVKATPSFML